MQNKHQILIYYTDRKLTTKKTLTIIKARIAQSNKNNDETNRYATRNQKSSSLSLL